MKIGCGADLCCVSTSLSAPDRDFRKADLGELRRAQMSFVRAEEFVELRRLDLGSGEHRMRLPAMMDLVLEQVREKARRILGLNAGAALHRNRHDELRFGQRCASIDQP